MALLLKVALLALSSQGVAGDFSLVQTQVTVSLDLAAAQERARAAQQRGAAEPRAVSEPPAELKWPLGAIPLVPKHVQVHNTAASAATVAHATATATAAIAPIAAAAAPTAATAAAATAAPRTATAAAAAATVATAAVAQPGATTAPAAMTVALAQENAATKAARANATEANAAEAHRPEHSTVLLATAKQARQRGLPAWVIVVIVVAVVILSFVLAVALFLQRSPRLRRFLHFYWTFRHILHEFKRVHDLPLSDEDKDKEREKLAEIFAVDIVEGIISLRGMFVKIGQLLSLHPAMPKPLAKELKRLSDQCKPLDSSELHRILDRELRSTEAAQRPDFDSWGDAVKQIFSRFDTKPIGVASIGQVHRACLREGNQEVVVKVQFPDVRSVFEIDLSCLKYAVQMAEGVDTWMYRTMNEVEGQLRQEFDYLQEAKNIETMRGVLLPEFPHDIALPEAITELSTDKILTMTFLEGERLDRVLGQKLEAVGLGEMAKVLKLKEEEMEVEGSHDLLVEEGSGTPPPTPAKDEPQVMVAAECQRIVRLLFDIWGHMILRAGVFHADPHPGNVLIMTNGRIGLVDFGQVKRLDGDICTQISRVCLGVLKADVPKTAAAVRRCGLRAEEDDQEVRLFLHAAKAFSRPSLLPTKDQIWAHTENGNAGAMTFVIRSLVLLGGMSAGLGYPIFTAEAWIQRLVKTPSEEEEIAELAKDLDRITVSGKYNLTLDTEDDTKDKEKIVGTITIQHVPGSPWFGGNFSFETSYGKRDGDIYWGHMSGVIIEFMHQDLIVRGVIKDQGRRLENIRVDSVIGPAIGIGKYNGVLAGRVGKALNIAKAKVVKAVFQAMPSLFAAKKGTFMQLQKQHNSTSEQSPEG